MTGGFKMEMMEILEIYEWKMTPGRMRERQKLSSRIQTKKWKHLSVLKGDYVWSVKQTVILGSEWLIIWCMKRADDVEANTGTSWVWQFGSVFVSHLEFCADLDTERQTWKDTEWQN